MAGAQSKSMSTLEDVWARRATQDLPNLKPHPVTGRLIDNYPGQRTRPMKVLVLGMSRTGTMSLLTALESADFNYRVYHMVKAMQAPRANFYTWIEGLRAKYHGVGKPWGREEFDKILGNFDAVADVPSICFAEELIKAYPDAKVVLNERDVDKWLESMNATCGVVFGWRSWGWVAPWDKALAKPWLDFAGVVKTFLGGSMTEFGPDSAARKAFLEHYERVKKLCPPERLLLYRVQEGWEPLCKFLDVPVPDREFPRVNDSKQFAHLHAMMWYMALGKMLLKMSSALAIPAVAVYLARQQGMLEWL